MPFNGSGSFSPPGADFPAVANTLIEASKFNNVINDIATGLSTCITVDGQSTITNNIPFSGNRLTGIGAPVAAGDALREGSPIGASGSSTGAFTTLTASTSVTVGSNVLGEWTSPAYSALNFTGSGSMTWTVDSGDVTTYAYTITGKKTMTVAFTIVTSSVGGTPSTDLEIKIPGGNTAAKSMTNKVAYCLDNNVLTEAFAYVAASGTLIVINRSDLGNWTASTNQTRVQGQITFEIN